MGGLCSGKTENPPSIAASKPNGRLAAEAPRVVYSVDKSTFKSNDSIKVHADHTDNGNGL